MLCSTCQDIFQKDKWVQGPLAEQQTGKGQAYAAHHASSLSFIKAVDEGCHICTVVAGFPQTQKELIDTKIHRSPFTHAVVYSSAFGPDDSSRYFSLHVTAMNPEIDEIKTQETEFELLSCKYFPRGGQTGSSWTNSSEAIDQIKEWIATCTRNHSTCSRTGESNVLPTRLLDLGKSATDRHVRLLISADHFPGFLDLREGQSKTKTHSYMTLSHRWGELEMPKLKTGNMDAFRQSIPFEGLPKTFQHAIELTRQLDIRYLWIDALCIIQDSREDWLNEGSTMAEIYRNAYCNIAATSATDSNGGLFYRRNPNVVTTSLVKPLWANACQREFMIAQTHLSIAEILNKQPLQQRGWVLQERFLAARTIHFTTDRLFFECGLHLTCEEYPNGIPDPHGEFCHSHKPQYSIHLDTDPEDEERLGLRKEIIEWNRMVEKYTKCNLTYESDKLMALSGIATHFSRTKLPQDRYLAGIWASQLPYALLWAHKDKTARKQAEYRAPSWSWASMDGAIDMGGTERNGGYMHADLAELHETEMTTISGNPTGPVSAGTIRIFGMVALAHVRGDEVFGISRITDQAAYPNVHDVHRGPEGWFQNRSARIIHDISTGNVTSAVQFIPILLIHYFDHEGGGPFSCSMITCVFGLALKTSGEETYERIGRVVFTGRKLIQGLLEFLRYPEGRFIKLV